jgi:hypothetical protein
MSTDKPADGRTKRPADLAAAPAAKAAKGTPPKAEDADKPAKKASDKPADPTLEGMGNAKAQAAFLFYRNMGPRRSILKMAETYKKDEGTVSARKRSFERWSTKYGWPEKAKAWDQEAADREIERKRKARERMDDNQAEAMAQLWFTALDRANELIAMDRVDQEAYRRAMQDWLGQDPQTRGDPPRKPKPSIGAYALANLMRTGLEYERIGRQAATEILGFAQPGEGMMPPVLEVRLTDQRPPDPVDPDEEGEHRGPPEAVRQAAAAALLPALARLTTRRPDEPADPDDEEGEDEGGEEEGEGEEGWAEDE